MAAVWRVCAILANVSNSMIAEFASGLAALVVLRSIAGDQEVPLLEVLQWEVKSSERQRKRTSVLRECRGEDEKQVQVIKKKQCSEVSARYKYAHNPCPRSHRMRPTDARQGPESCVYGLYGIGSARN
jgi:hypothetical protein